MGQGDATVIESPAGKVVVVDGGGKPGTDAERTGDDPGTRTVVPYLRYRGISTVDWLVATHADDDHAQGLIAVVEGLNVRAALDSGFGGTSGPYRRLMTRLQARRIPVSIARRGQRIDLGGGASMEVLHPTSRYLKGTRSDTNSNSIVLRIRYGRSRILLLADAEAETEADLLRANPPPALHADVLKAGHHGARNSTTEALLRAVNPSAAVISCGKKNNFGHPAPEVLSRLAAHHVRVFRTDRQGAVVVETDGDRLRITPTVAVR